MKKKIIYDCRAQGLRVLASDNGWETGIIIISKGYDGSVVTELQLSDGACAAIAKHFNQIVRDHGERFTIHEPDPPKQPILESLESQSGPPRGRYRARADPRGHGTRHELRPLKDEDMRCRSTRC